MPEKKRNTTFSISEKTREKLRSMSEYSGLSMSTLLDMLVESAEVTRPSIHWNVTGKPPIQSPCRDS